MFVNCSRKISIQVKNCELFQENVYNTDYTVCNTLNQPHKNCENIGIYSHQISFLSHVF